ncbi:MAG: hypothetical protein IT161_11225 [Bryobacterales bacterium]|nr:hypothetical protein [Bryobacterales bacterium]
MQVVLQFKTGVELTEDLVMRLDRPFRALAKMGQWGGMAGDSYAPQQSTIVLVADGTRHGIGGVRWEFEVTRVHSGTAFVIQNVAHYLHLNVAPLESLVLRSQLLSDGAPVREELPEDYEPHPFIVNYERESTQVSVDVDFSDRQDPVAAEPFREAWDAWYEVAAHGGFSSEDYAPEETKIFVEEELQVTSTGIGGVFDDVVIDDAGFYCLINMLEVLHHRLTPITEVTIE